MSASGAFRRRLPALALIPLLWLQALTTPAAAQAQALVSPRLQAEAARIFNELAQLRGLPAPGSAPRVVVRSREERRRFIAGELARKYPAARLDAERRAMVTWGLIPPEFDLSSFLTSLVLEQAAAYYDPVNKVMVLANWLPPDEQREALTHELVHALQDRQIDLDRFLTANPGKGDETLARQALIEGEAVALTLDLTHRRLGLDLARLPDVLSVQRAILTSVTGPVLGRAPRFLRAMLTFPYAHGLGFVHQFRRRQPWVNLSTLYRDPPRTSAQILHPERYLDRREDPVPITLPDLGAVLGPGMRRVFEDEMGEFGLTEVLKQFLGEGARVGTWQGDRYALWEDAAGTLLLAALTIWETQDAAAAFARAYGQLLAGKHGLAASTPTGSLTTWPLGTHVFAVEQRDREVLILERAPLAALDVLRGVFWQGRPGASRREAPAPSIIAAP